MATLTLVNQPSTQSSTSPKSWRPEDISAALQARLSLSEAVKIVGQMLAGYERKPTGKDLEAYILTLASVLVEYPRHLAEKSANPFDGVPSQCRYGIPNPGDIAEWFKPRVAELEGVLQRDYERRLKPLEDRQALPPPIVKHTSIDELRQKHGPHWGLRGFDNFDEARGDAHRLRHKSEEEVRRNAQQVLDKWAAEANEPIPISPSLVRSIREAQGARQMEAPPVFELDPDNWDA